MAPTRRMMKARRREKRMMIMMMMMKRRWSTWLWIIPKKTLGMTQMLMHQGLLELLSVEPVVVSFYFYLYLFFFLFSHLLA